MACVYEENTTTVLVESSVVGMCGLSVSVHDLYAGHFSIPSSFSVILLTRDKIKHVNSDNRQEYGESIGELITERTADLWAVWLYAGLH